MNQKELYQFSIELIERYQHPSGAFIASPNFENYGYSWLRDGSYIAAALDRVGHRDSAASFHCWVDGVVRRYHVKINGIRSALTEGEPLSDRDFLFTRYSLDGFEDLTDETWGNFQYDGYGTWLWSFSKHIDRWGDADLVRTIWPSVRHVLDYLSLVWRLPSYDCWEEHPELLHPYSMGCVYGGMQAALALADRYGLPLDRSSIEDQSTAIHEFVLEKGVCEGSLVKHIYPNGYENFCCRPGLDASLLGLIHPYGLVDINSTLSDATLQAIRDELTSPSGGIYRYAKDTYYGGGTWILLTAWLGWIEALAGDRDRARERLDWIVSRTDGKGWLAEQLTDEVLFPEMTKPWIERWGPVATPLLWSHAMYLNLYTTLKEKDDTLFHD